MGTLPLHAKNLILMRRFYIYLFVIISSLVIGSCSKDEDMVPEVDAPEVDIYPIELFFSIEKYGSCILDSSFVANNGITATFRNKTYNLKPENKTKMAAPDFKGFLYTTFPGTSKDVLYFGQIDASKNIDNENLIITWNNKPQIITINHKIIWDKSSLLPKIEQTFFYDGKSYTRWQVINLTE